MLALVTAAPAHPARAQAATPPAAAGAGGVAGRIDALLADPALRHATVGVLVRSLRDGRVLYERNSDLALVPASNQKILTAAAALSRLGPDYRYRTCLYRTGAIDAKGTLQGDLVLRGMGDPSLTSAHLAELAGAVRAAGVREIAGGILADDTRFDALRLGVNWSWDDEPFWYQPQISALNCDGNVVAVTVAPGPRPGDPAAVTLRPATAYVRVLGGVTTAPAGAGRDALPARVTFGRARARNDFLLGGAIPVGARPVTEEITIEEPALFAATRLAETLRAGGVKVAGGAPLPGKVPPGAVPLAQTLSEPLAVLLRHFLKASDNLYGEVLLKTLGAEVAGEGTGAFGAGGRVAEAALRRAGVDTGALAIADGSGLSRSNAVTPRGLVTLLTWLHVQAPPPVAAAFREALPIGGVDGTLRNRFRGTPAAGAVRAKTGSLSGASSLSGYVTTRVGEPLAFSILMNNVLGGARAARAAQDSLVLALIDALPASGDHPEL